MQTESLDRDKTEEQLLLQIAALSRENAALRKANGELRETAVEQQLEPVSRRAGLRQHLLTDEIAQIVWTSKPDGSVDYYNRGWFEYTGMTFEQTRGDGWQAVVHPDDLLADERRTALFCAGEAYGGEFRIRRASDGMYRWHLSRITPIRDSDGKLVCWVGTSTDIHDFKLAQQSLRQKNTELEARVAERTAELADTVARLETEKQFIAAVADNISDGVIACDAKGILRFFNARARWFHAQGIEPVPQEQWAEEYQLFLSDGQTLMTADQVPLARVLKGEEIVQEEMVVRPRNGQPARRLRVNGCSFYDAAGKKLGAVVGLHDVTESAAAEERFRTLFEQSSFAHLLFDETGIVDCNNAAVTLLGCATKSQLLSRRPEALSPEFQPDGKKSAEKSLEMAALGRGLGVHKFEWTHRKMDGSDFPAEVTITPVTLKGKPSMIAVLNDLTEREHADDALKHAYRELSRSEQRFQAFMDNSPVYSWIKDESGKLVYVNSRFAAAFGELPKDMLGKTDAERFSINLAQQYADEDRQVIAAGPLSGDHDVLVIGGEIRQWQFKKFLLTDPEGRRYAAGLSTDVTDQRRAEKALRDNEQRLRMALAAGKMGIFIVDLARNVVTNDAVMNQLHGLDDSTLEWDLTTAFNRVHPDDRATTMALFEKAIAGGGRGDISEYRIVHPDGSIHWLAGVGAMAGPHAPNQFVGVQFDITLRKENEELARQSQQRFKTFMDRSPALATIKDENSQIIYFNEPFKVLFPEKTISILEKRPVFPPDVVKKLKELDQEALEQGSVEAQLIVPTPDGTPHRFQISKFRFVDSNKHRYIGSIWHDVTELVSARVGAEAASRAKSEFLANMSHEIRTPMTAILGHVDLMDQSGLTADERKQHVEVIRRNGQHLLAVLNDVLDLSKIEAGKMTVEQIAFAPLDLIGELESLISPRADQKLIGFTVEIDQKIPPALYSDPTRLRQILLNLLGNAIKFTDRGGVRLIVRPTPEGHPEKLRFDIVDTGIGMSTAQLASLFKPFSQGDSSTSRRFGGSGLGLIICQRLVRMLGGTLSATSEPNVGSTFSFTIDADVAPTRTPEAGTPAPAKTTPEFTRSLSGRILLAEDSDDIRRIVLAMLATTGLQVDIAEDGAIALDRISAAALEGHSYDLVLMDMQMPLLDGYTATRQLRSRGFVSLPVIAFTAHAMEPERQKSIAAGCNGYVLKPINRDALLSTIAEYIGPISKPRVRSQLAEDRFVKPLLAEFVSTLPAVRVELTENLGRGDFSAISERVHRLKGAAGMYGFAEITQNAREVELCLAEQNAEKIGLAIKGLIDLLGRVDTEIPS